MNALMVEDETHARGKMTAHPAPVILYSRGNTSRLKTIIIAMQENDINIVSQNRLKIFGTSLKKLENSTSFLVEVLHKA